MGETMQGLNRTHRCTEVNEGMIGVEVTVMGWVNKRRDLGRLIFIAIRDRSGIIQAVIDGNNADPAIFAKAETIRSEYVLACKGIVRYRSEGNTNESMETGKIELEVIELRILSESETPPFQIEAGGQVKDDMRLKYRYLDLRRADMQRNMKMRHDTAQLIRQFLSGEGFYEMDTPMLTKSTPEGARDYIVPSRIHPGSFYALPQSPQLFKQLLMVSGMDKYFQIAKCFRDEDLRADRQPEFTQIDMELSFVNADDVIAINEKLIQKIFKDILGVEVKAPFQRMTYTEAMERYGSDKPDLRFGLELVDLSEMVANCNFNVFKAAIESGGSVRGINAKGCGDFPRKRIDALVEFCKTYRAKGLAWIAITPQGEIKSQLTKFFNEAELKTLIDKLGGKNGDLLLICADKDEVVFDSLGALRCEIADKTGLLSKDEYKFLWVTEFPLLEWSEDDGRFYAKHHPFTAPMDEDITLLDTDPRSVRAKAYDIVLNGVEIGGGSIRIHQSDIQKKMLDILGFTEESAQAGFGFLLEAFKYGVPPHGGLAYGFDRLIMLLAGLDNIRDVIAFPKVKDASCPLTAAPDSVEQKQLDELSIRVVEKEAVYADADQI